MSSLRLLFVVVVCGLTSSCTAQSLIHRDNYIYFNVSGCLAFFARSISVKFVSGKAASIVPIPASSLSLSPLSKCSDLKSLLVFTSSNVNEISDLNASLGFIKSGRYWSMSQSSVSIKCQSGSKSCVNVAGNPLVMKWAGAPINLGYKCTKPSAAPVILPSDSGNSVSLQFASIQVQPFGVKDGVFGDVTDCVGFLFQYQYVDAVQGCSIFYQLDFKWKKALCDSELNKLQEIPFDLPINLIELRIIHQSIKKIKKNSSLYSLIHLELLHIESSELKHIESDTFKQLISLKSINLRNNSLKLCNHYYHGDECFPSDIFHNLPNLISLNLAENFIDFIPDSFFNGLQHYNLKLKYLWLNSMKSINGIKFESNHFMKPLIQLRLLDLSYTGLYELDSSNELAFNKMIYLNEFYLGGNPWLCDCKLNWLKLWFLNRSSTTSSTISSSSSATSSSLNKIQYQQNKTNSNGHIELIEPICYKPDQLKGKLILTNNQLNSLQFHDLYCIPQIFTLNQNLTFYYHHQMLLTCEYYTTNINDLLWYKDNQQLFKQNTTHYSITYGQLGANFYSNLLIPLTTEQDTGLWSCVLNNQYRTLFHVTILNSNGEILYPNNNDNENKDSFLYKVFTLFGNNNNNQINHWIYGSIIIIILFVILILISIGIFCCYHSQSSRLTNRSIDEINMKNCISMNKSRSICRRRLKCINGSHHYHHHSNNKKIKDDSINSLLVTTNDEPKIIDKNELQLTNHMKEDTIVTSTTIITTTTIPNSNIHVNHVENNDILSSRNIDENRLLNIFCCPTNSTRDVQLVTIPTTSSSSTNVTCLDGSFLQGTVVTDENHVLVSCDSPEPKLYIATNGITPSSNISTLDFSNCLQQQQQPLNVMPQPSCTGWDTSGGYSSPQFPGIYTSSQITIETSKPCPVHGIMNLKPMEINCDITTNTTIDSNHANVKQLPNYKKIDSIYWDHSNSSAILTNPHLSYNLSNCVFLDSQNYGTITNGSNRNSDPQKNEIEVMQNYSKTLSSYHNIKDYSFLQKANLNEANIQWPTDSRSQGTCPVHGNQTLTRRNDQLKHTDKEDVTLGNRKNLKRNHRSKSIIREQPSYLIDRCHHGTVDNQEASISSSNETNDNEETHIQLNSVHNNHYGLSITSIKPKQIIYTSNEETESQGESSLSEKSLHSDHSCTSSVSSSTNSTSSINQHFKYIYPSNQTGLNSICSSLSNQINLAAAAAAASTNATTDLAQQQSPPSLEFCPSPELLRNRPNSTNSYSRHRNHYDILNNLKCPVHSLPINRRSLPHKLFYDAYNHRENMRQHNYDHNNNIGTLRVTTLPTRFRKVSYNINDNNNNNNNNNRSSSSSSGSSSTTNDNNNSSINNHMASIRKFASQHTIQSNYSSSLCLSTTQSLDKFNKSLQKSILRPGSKHKLDTESDSDNNNNNNTSEENNF
ncbi:unnamed protein product [Schistosoma haematobium]|nr:unnamed protein product [Schistosoma haematobium]